VNIASPSLQIFGPGHEFLLAVLVLVPHTYPEYLAASCFPSRWGLAFRLPSTFLPLTTNFSVPLVQRFPYILLPHAHISTPSTKPETMDRTMAPPSFEQQFLEALIKLKLDQWRARATLKAGINENWSYLFGADHDKLQWPETLTCFDGFDGYYRIPLDDRSPLPEHLQDEFKRRTIRMQQILCNPQLSDLAAGAERLLEEEIDKHCRWEWAGKPGSSWTGELEVPIVNVAEKLAPLGLENKVRLSPRFSCDGSNVLISSESWPSGASSHLERAQASICSEYASASLTRKVASRSRPNGCPIESPLVA
jgi:hypothetical protein